MGEEEAARDWLMAAAAHRLTRRSQITNTCYQVESIISTASFVSIPLARAPSDSDKAASVIPAGTRRNIEEIKSSQIESNRVKSSQIESNRVKSRQIESNRDKSSQIK